MELVEYYLIGLGIIGLMIAYSVIFLGVNVSKIVAMVNSKKLPQIKVDKTPFISKSFKEFANVAFDKRSTAQELAKSALEILRYFPIVGKEYPPHPKVEFGLYNEYMIALCKHKQTNKETLLHFSKEFNKNNPQYKDALDMTLSKGLKQRK